MVVLDCGLNWFPFGKELVSSKFMGGGLGHWDFAFQVFQGVVGVLLEGHSLTPKSPGIIEAVLSCGSD